MWDLNERIIYAACMGHLSGPFDVLIRGLQRGQRLWKGEGCENRVSDQEKVWLSNGRESVHVCALRPSFLVDLSS